MGLNAGKCRSFVWVWLVTPLWLLAIGVRSAEADIRLEFFKGTSVNDTVINVAEPLSSVQLLPGGPPAFVQVVMRQTAPTTLLGPTDGLAAYMIQAVYGAGQSGVFLIPGTTPTGGSPVVNVGDSDYALLRSFRTGSDGNTPGGNQSTATAFRFGGLNLNPPPSPSVDVNGRILLGTFRIDPIANGTSSLIFRDPNPAPATIDNISDIGDNIDAVLFAAAHPTFVLPVRVSQVPATPTSFVYQGQLKEGGAPVNGAVDLEFTLWDAEAGGNAVGSLVVLDGVAVSNGLFTVGLDFGASAFEGSERWLQVAVNGTTLGSRQHVAATPYAQFAAAPWAKSGPDLTYLEGNVGIGIDTPTATLHLYRPEQTFGAGSRLAFGDDLTTPTGTNAHVAEYGWEAATDSDQLQVHAKLGIHFTTGSAVPPQSRMFIHSNGSVGVGTVSPAARLHVQTDFNQRGFEHNDGTHNLITWLGTSEGTEGAWIGPATPHALSLQTSNIARLTVAADGRVGIGTTTPASRLHVLSPDVIPLQIESTSPTATRLLLKNESIANYFALVMTGTGSSIGGGKFFIGESDGTNLSPRLVIDNAGRVGIGTTAPVSKLEVVHDDSRSLTLRDTRVGQFGTGGHITLQDMFTGAQQTATIGSIGNDGGRT